MSGTSLNLSFFLLCSLIVSSAGYYASPDILGFLGRFYRSEGAADAAKQTADHLNVPGKPSSVDKQKAVQVNPSSNISTTSSVTPKSRDSKPDDPHVKSPDGETEQDIPTVVGTQHNLNQGALLRGFYVFVGLSAIVVIYIVVKTISVRRKKSTVRKYGILTNREDVEMTPLGAEDDEEDTTLFDVSNQTRP